MKRSVERFARLIAAIQRPLLWVGMHEATLLAALFIVIASCWTFAELADDVMEGDTQRFDEWAILALRRADNPGVPIGPRWVHEVGRDLTALGGLAVVTLVTAAVAGFLWLRRMYGAMLLVLSATFGGVLVSSLFKWLFQRDRPSLVPHLSIVHSSSFPSGHSMVSAVVYLTLGALLARVSSQRLVKAYFLLVALILTTLVGLSRIYLGVHYPTDVLAGWAAGLAWALGCWLIARWLQRRGAVERAVEQPAPAEQD